MKIEEVIEHFGGSRALSRRMDIGASAIRAWTWNGKIPEKHHTKLIEMSERMGSERIGKPLTREDIENAS